MYNGRSASRRIRAKYDVQKTYHYNSGLDVAVSFWLVQAAPFRPRALNRDLRFGDTCYSEVALVGWNEDLSILKDQRKHREVRNHTMANPERADGVEWPQRAGDRGGADVWMGEKVDTWSQMPRWDASEGRMQKETSWEADFEDVYAQEWAGAYPGPWRQKGYRSARREEMHK